MGKLITITYPALNLPSLPEFKFVIYQPFNYPFYSSFFFRGGGAGRGEVSESHTPRKAAVSQKVVSRPSSRVWLAELMKCLALAAAPASTPFSFFLNRNV